MPARPDYPDYRPPKPMILPQSGKISDQYEQANTCHAYNIRKLARCKQMGATACARSLVSMDIHFIDQANYYPETLHPLGQSSIGGVKRWERSAATLR
jgi:hypothetical protein